jgi:hypothetical protein
MIIRTQSDPGRGGGFSELAPSEAQREEADLLANLNEHMQRALLAAGVRVQSSCLEFNEGTQGICAAVILDDARMEQDAAAVLDRFVLRYQLM